MHHLNLNIGLNCHLKFDKLSPYMVTPKYYKKAEKFPIPFISYRNCIKNISCLRGQVMIVSQILVEHSLVLKQRISLHFSASNSHFETFVFLTLKSAPFLEINLICLDGIPFIKIGSLGRRV